MINENHIGSAVSEIIWYIQTNTHKQRIPVTLLLGFYNFSPKILGSFRYTSLYPTLVCNLLDKKHMYILYLTFMAEIIMFKAILIHFPITFLNLNTSKIKFTCVLIGFLHYVIAIGVVVADIYTENCGFINSLDMDEAYDLIDRNQMVQFTKYKHVFQWGFIGIVFPIIIRYNSIGDAFL